MISQLLNETYFNRHEFPKLKWQKDLEYLAKLNNTNTLSAYNFSYFLCQFVRRNEITSFDFKWRSELSHINSQDSLLDFIEKNLIQIETSLVAVYYNSLQIDQHTPSHESIISHYLPEYASDRNLMWLIKFMAASDIKVW